MDPAGRPPRLEARGIVKSFHGATALRGVDFDLLPGEVHGLVGENGAGKSTLIKILTGVQPADSGTIRYDGEPVSFASPGEAQRRGVTAIYQEVNLVPTLSAAENIFIGREPRTRLGTIDWRRLHREAGELAEHYRIRIDLRRPVGELGLAAQQMVAIVRALSQNGRVLVMDEPTSSLTHQEVDQLLRTIADIARSDVSIIYISHRLDELFRIAARITVLRDGERILTEATSSLSRGRLVEAMLGRSAATVVAGTRAPVADAGNGLVVTGLGSGRRVTSASVSVARGEIVGLAGLQGSGRTEAMRAIFGADARSAGSVALEGRELKPAAPVASLARGLAYLPEDRKADGIVPGLSVRENLALILLPRLGRFGIVSRRRERQVVDEFIQRLGIRAANADIPIRDLSGGNQQKVLIARLLCIEPGFLMLDDPMRGIDIGAKAEIQRLIVELSGSGLGVLLTSSELEEVLALSHKVTIVRDGVTLANLPAEAATFEAVAAAIAGGGAAA